MSENNVLQFKNRHVLPDLIRARYVTVPEDTILQIVELARQMLEPERAADRKPTT